MREFFRARRSATEVGLIAVVAGANVECLSGAGDVNDPAETETVPCIGRLLSAIVSPSGVAAESNAAGEPAASA